VSKASAGALEVFTPLAIRSSTVEDFLIDKREQEWQIVATNVRENDRFIDSFPILDRPTILILGSEGKGIPESITSRCTHNLCLKSGRKLPPGLDSLNVSVAAALLMQGLIKTKG